MNNEYGVFVNLRVNACAVRVWSQKPTPHSKQGCELAILLVGSSGLYLFSSGTPTLFQ